jgi:glycosyltransferase involved in cell wall biosynthesis
MGGSYQNYFRQGRHFLTYMFTDIRKIIFSITRSSYVNSGHITDFFKEYADVYAVLSFSSHNTNAKDKTKLLIYEDSKLRNEVDFPTLPKNPPVYLVPFYQLYFCFNVVWAMFLLKFRYKFTPDICVTSFCLWSLTARFMQFFGFCKKSIFWSWDYFPKVRESSYYWLLVFFEPFEKLAIQLADFSWYASQTNFDKRVEIGQVGEPSDLKHSVVHWGTGGNLTSPVTANYLDSGVLRLVYFGSINKEKGLDIVMEALPKLVDLTNGNLEVLIIGGDTSYKTELKNKAHVQNLDKYIVFKDFMSTEEFDVLAKTCDLGLALFVPEIGGEPNFTYYADPSKPRDYLANGLPVIITAVPFIHKDITEYNAGFTLKKYDKECLVEAIEMYLNDPEKYREGAFNLAQVDRYDKYYKEHFDMVFDTLS